jgi:dephospho-CoA kinase
VVGLAGGVGSGKSTVAKILEDLGAGVISSDRLSHEELNSDEIKTLLTHWWGDQIVAPDGSVDRSRVSAIVFSDTSQRARLESVLHPRIAMRRSEILTDMQQDTRVTMVVIDSPLLFETNLDPMCDTVIFVDAGIEQRRERSEKARNWPDGELIRREKTQQPLDTKRARADYVCENNSSPAALRKQVEGIYSQILSEFGTN